MSDGIRRPAPIKAPEPAFVFENPYGEATDEQLAGQPLTDPFYLKGYSDVRHERDLDIKRGKKPQGTLPHRFQWVSVQNRVGQPIGDKLLEYRTKGYRLVQWSELAGLGIDAEGSAASPAPDGTVMVGTQRLMVTDAANAARQYRAQRADTERQAKDRQEQSKEKAARYNTTWEHSEEVRKDSGPFSIQ